MKAIREKYYLFPFIAAMLLAVLLAFPSSAEAQQTSLDKRIFEAFEKIDGRTNAHDQSVVQMRKRMEEIATEFNKLQNELESLPAATSDEGTESRRRTLRSQLINLSAEHISQAYKLVDSAAAVISANLTDLALLAEEARKTTKAGGGARKLKLRIEKNISAGRAMRRALLELRRWSRRDPVLATRFISLRRIAGALDRKISIDKARLAGRRTDSTGEIRNERLAALNRTVDQLGDMYVEVATRKEELKDLRDEVVMSIQLGRLEMTREIAARAVPSLAINGKTPSSEVRTLKEVATGIARLNASLMKNSGSVTPASLKADGGVTALVTDDFSNF